MKRGSALLIVLGMIAFMVISAVAFSALMRHSRLPSSYLRRTSASRLLVKAALAEAIDLIDIAIGNDPFPGIGDDAQRGWGSPRDAVNGQVQSVAKRNHWRGHVFIGTNQLCAADETVSTLTLEGLAYLPPPLINEARYYSRHSVAGVWRNLGFDAGRYAFCAVDVSDHLDINRIFADRGRNSSDAGRVTLAHVFENAAHTGAGSPSAKNWDDFIAKFNDAVDVSAGQNPPGANQGSTKLPFTSLADLNLAINKEQSGWVETMSPFCRFIRNGTSFVTGMSGEDNERIRQMAFVTDSCTPSTNSANSAKFDLCGAQPFTNSKMRSLTDQVSFEEQLSESNPILERLFDKVTTLDTVSLCDYLDMNDIPTSLGLPSVEAVPMICAVMPSVNFELVQKAPETSYDPGGNAEPPAPTGLEQSYLVRKAYKLELNNPGGLVQALCLFPFRHGSDRAKSFTAEFAIRLSLSTGDGPGLRRSGTAFAIGGEPDFKTTAAVQDGMAKGWAEATPKLSFKSQDILTEANAFKTVTANLNQPLEQIANQLRAAELFTVTYRIGAKKVSDDPPRFDWDRDNPQIDTTHPPTVNTALLHPTDERGLGDGGFNRDYLTSRLATCQVRPYLTVTGRIVSETSHKTVDLVPAHYDDDLGFNNLPAGAISRDDITAVSGADRPFLTLAGPDLLTFSEAAFDGSAKTVTLSPTPNGGVYVCPDPRWNFAPENFYVMDGSSLPDASTFVTACDFENDGRDCDMFLMCSDQGYMQSPSEFAFLPRTTTAQLPIAGSQVGSCRATYNRAALATGTGGAAPYGDLAHGSLMWKTYRLFKLDGVDDNIYDLGVTLSGSGYRVNPFTSSRDVMMAALANTPVSWWAASTNDIEEANGKLADEDAQGFNRDFAFNEMNSKAKIAWKDLQKVADRFVSVFRRNDGNWQRAFADLDWDGENSDLCGVNFDSTDVDTVLKDVDRKMLYGFWRDSLGVKQQLFLIFVRAEPMMMGGGAVGQTPPQLGARAVALVWRDPAPTRTDVGSSQPRPHRTRILFYRQFD